jgi:hypothetical protein
MIAKDWHSLNAAHKKADFLTDGRAIEGLPSYARTRCRWSKVLQEALAPSTFVKAHQRVGSNSTRWTTSRYPDHPAYVIQS